MSASVSKRCLLINLVERIKRVINEVWADLLENEGKDAIVSSFDDA
jgi:hypothetical protein